MKTYKMHFCIDCILSETELHSWNTLPNSSATVYLLHLLKSEHSDHVIWRENCHEIIRKDLRNKRGEKSTQRIYLEVQVLVQVSILLLCICYYYYYYYYYFQSHYQKETSTCVICFRRARKSKSLRFHGCWSGSSNFVGETTKSAYCSCRWITRLQTTSRWSPNVTETVWEQRS